MDRIGAVSFQANDGKDIFHVADVREDGIEVSDEELSAIEDTQFDSDQEWVTGRGAKMKPVHVDGDTSVIHAWYRAEAFDKSFAITVYVEYEETEELLSVEPEEKSEDDNSDPALEPQEINL